MIVSFSGKHRFLSNFHPVEVELEGILYQSVEHAYQAAKTTRLKARAEIRSGTAGEAKRLGRSVVMRPNWESVKLLVMKDLLRQKFRHPELQARLLATGDDELIEGNTWGDSYWGVCNGVGENHLGKLLMMIREDLRHV